MEGPGLAGQVLTVKQAPFSHEGFASTGETPNRGLGLASCLGRCAAALANAHLLYT